MVNVQLCSPYSNCPLPWLRGNLHCHSTNSDGCSTPQEIVDQYAQQGYDFLAITDHDYLTDPSTLDSRGLVLLAGSEVTAHGPDLLHLDAPRKVMPSADRQQVLAEIAQVGGWAVANHPNWGEAFCHVTQAELERWQGYVGIEIYNAIIRFLAGSPLATDRWDRLLSAGRRVWGFANDDSHAPEHVGKAWNVVQCAERTRTAICDALRCGRFYASTGVVIDEIRTEDHTLYLRAADAEQIVLLSDHGVRRASAEGGQLAYVCPPDAGWTYLRAECYGRGEAMAWTQPFFLERPPACNSTG